MMRLRFDEPRPLTVHMLLTTACNLNCDGCFYRRERAAEIPFKRIVELLDEFADGGVKTIALGGGEPTLYPEINGVVEEAKERGLYVAVTTNGVNRHEFTVPPDRVHVSYSRMHEEAIRRTRRRPLRLLRSATEHYRKRSKTGLNLILTDMDRLKFLDAFLGSRVDQITILLEKPESTFEAWDRLFDYIGADRERYWIDACLMKLARGIGCKQGVSSFCIDQNLMAYKCSNTKTKIPYTFLSETWTEIREIGDCIINPPTRLI